MLRAFTAILLSLALVAPAHAQLFPSSLTLERLTIDSSPAFPSGRESVFLTVRSVSLDLDSADIIWLVDNKPVASGTGQRGVTVTLGPLGSRTRITVTATTGEGESFTTERTISPAEVDLLWEAASYVPPFYQGRRLPSSSSPIRAEALARLLRPDGTQISSRDIVYTWSKNGGIVSNISGRGRSVVTLPPAEFSNTDTISVEASSLDGVLIAASSVRLPSVDPFVLLYQDHPIFGILYHTNITPSMTLPDIEATFAAVPYFAFVAGPNDTTLAYTWSVNGAPITPDAQTPSRLTINAENSDGAARVELSLSHAIDFLMSAQGVWDLSFNSGFGTIGTGLFGTPE